MKDESEYRCPVCKSDDWEFFEILIPHYPLNDSRIKDGSSVYDFLRCNNCGIVFDYLIAQKNKEMNK